jgi:hypothetical protein
MPISSVHAGHYRARERAGAPARGQHTTDTTLLEQMHRFTHSRATVLSDEYQSYNP